jgi:transposase
MIGLRQKLLTFWSAPLRLDWSGPQDWPVGEDFEGWKPMPSHRSRSIKFKRQVAQEYIGGETLHGLAKRHDISRNLIRIWVSKCEAGAFDDDAKAAELLQEQEARIAALERLVGRQALELEFLKNEMRSVRSTRSAPISVITGPPASLSRKDAD